VTSDVGSLRMKAGGTTSEPGHSTTIKFK